MAASNETHDIAMGHPFGDHRKPGWMRRNPNERQNVLVPESCPSDNLLDQPLGKPSKAIIYTHNPASLPCGRYPMAVYCVPSKF